MWISSGTFMLGPDYESFLILGALYDERINSDQVVYRVLVKGRVRHLGTSWVHENCVSISDPHFTPDLSTIPQ